MDRPASWRRQAIDLAAERPFRIAGAHIDPISRDAHFTGGCERLQPQNLKVLIALVRRKGDVVTRDELVDSCWDGRVIGEDVINHSISVLRDFAERAGGFKIETVPKAGYRLVETGASAWLSPRSWIVAAAFVFVLVFAAATLWVSHPDRQGEPPTPTIAVLPFASSDPATSALARDTRASLSHALSDSGFPVQSLSPEPADERSTADLIISGEIAAGPDRDRATVQIEERATHTTVYSHQFEADRRERAIFPERIGAQVAAALSWTGALMALDRRHPSSPATRASLLRQMTLLVEGGDRMRAYEIASRIAPQDPNSAIAQVALAFDTAFVLDQLPRDQRRAALGAARHASERGLALAPEFGDAYAPWCFLHSPMRTAECEDRLRAGLEADPNAPFVAFFLSEMLGNVGRSAEALDLARLSLANDRYKLWKISRVLLTLETEGRGGEAERLFQQGNRWWPNHRALIWQRWVGMLDRGDFAAMERFERSLPRDALPPEARTPLALFAAIRSRDSATARSICAGKPALDLVCMIGLARLGDLDDAFAIADRAYPTLRGRTAAEEERLWLDNPDSEPVTLLTSRSAAPLRRDPRYVALADRVGLLRYWRAGRLPDFCTRDHEPVCTKINSGAR